MKNPAFFGLSHLLALFALLAPAVRPAEAPSAAAPANRRFQVPATDDGLPGAGPIRRYDWFQNLWRDRRTGWAKRVQQDQGAIVFLGDSITQGWSDLGTVLPGVKVANRGISGDTTRTFPRDFVLKLEFRASPAADSGIFVREPQLQCRDYLIAGPFVHLKQYRPLDWNEVVITVKGGLAHATCNGEVLVDAFPVPATGPIGVESDKGQMEYRRIRVQEMQ